MRICLRRLAEPIGVKSSRGSAFKDEWRAGGALTDHHDEDHEEEGHPAVDVAGVVHVQWSGPKIIMGERQFRTLMPHPIENQMHCSLLFVAVIAQFPRLRSYGLL